jgi:hypothetical protein
VSDGLENQPILSSKTTSEPISIEEADVKPTPPLMSSMDAKIDEDVILNLKKSVRKKELAKEMGIDEGSEEAQELDKSFSIIMFKIGSMLIGCPKFELTDNEAAIFTDSLNAILKELGVKLSGFIIHVLVLFCIVAVKCINCKVAIQEKFKGLGTKKSKGTFDEKKQAKVWYQ